MEGKPESNPAESTLANAWGDDDVMISLKSFDK
jgi:hypothetical protein